jgi:hypothetical protein
MTVTIMAMGTVIRLWCSIQWCTCNTGNILCLSCKYHHQCRTSRWLIRICLKHTQIITHIINSPIRKNNANPTTGRGTTTNKGNISLSISSLNFKSSTTNRVIFPHCELLDVSILYKVVISYETCSQRCLWMRQSPFCSIKLKMQNDLILTFNNEACVIMNSLNYLSSKQKSHSNYAFTRLRNNSAIDMSDSSHKKIGRASEYETATTWQLKSRCRKILRDKRLHY